MFHIKKSRECVPFPTLVCAPPTDLSMKPTSNPNHQFAFVSDWTQLQQLKQKCERLDADVLKIINLCVEI